MVKFALKWLLIIILVLLAAFAVWQRDLVAYGIMQGQGQFNILWNARPVDEVLADPTVPDSLKQRLHLAGEVRDWGVKNLGLRETENYTTLYDQKGKDVLWVITASKPYSLESKEWSFPVVGTVGYKGFFDYEKMLKEEAALQAEGYETYTRPVGAWSTLGWFTDPLMSNLLFRSEGDLINTILHELTHATIFVKDSLDFNENLATFVGHHGALAYLKSVPGDTSQVYGDYVDRYADRQVFSEHMLNGLKRLRNLYESLPPNLPDFMKENRKRALINQIKREIGELPLRQPDRWQAFYQNLNMNNAYFLSYERYRGEQQELTEQFEQEFGRDLKALITYYKAKHGQD
jgi:predicted aminopeptidase